MPHATRKVSEAIERGLLENIAEHASSGNLRVADVLIGYTLSSKNLRQSYAPDPYEQAAQSEVPLPEVLQGLVKKALA